MYKRVIARPNGQIEYIYSDRVIVEEKDGSSLTRITNFSKDKNERIFDILNSSNKRGYH